MTAAMNALLSLLIFSSFHAQAGNLDFSDAKAIDDARGECVKRSKSPAAVLGCTSMANQQMDDLLKEAYDTLKDIAEKEVGQTHKAKEILRRLAEKQAVWPKFRELECRFQSAPKVDAGDRAEEIAFSSCLFSETKMRYQTFLGMIYRWEPE